jgi:hypothetical protein
MELSLSRYGVIPISICFVLIVAAFSYAGDLDKPYSPTRAEWLHLSIFKLIKLQTDGWQYRIAFKITISEEKNTVDIALSSPIDQGVLSQVAETWYVNTVKKSVEALLKEYDWSKNLKVYVAWYSVPRELGPRGSVRDER